jgi:dethiobiotin synthetase
MGAIFVTGTGTAIGKTFLCEQLLHALRGQGRAVAALKPVITGYQRSELATNDVGRLLAALGEPLDEGHIDRIAPWRFRLPQSPLLAAAREGRVVDFAALVAFSRERITASGDGVLIIEGVGGVMVPLDATHTVLDWIAALRVPVVLVAGSYLGSLSHTLSAFEVLRARDAVPSTIVVDQTPHSTVTLADTCAALAAFTAPSVVLPLGWAGDPAHAVQLRAIAERVRDYALPMAGGSIMSRAEKG